VKQILQNAKSGELELVEVPAPTVTAGQVLVRTHFSVVSPGTEKLALSFARKSLLGKARSRPDLVRQVVRKLRQEGPLPTYRTVMTRLEAPQPLGYSSAGIVLEVGAGVAGFVPGDRVACAGAGYASHAELVVVPESLVARVPESVSLEQAAFTTLGAIAMQGLRVAQPTIGEIAAVIGLGLIGQLAVQLLRANGCRVLAIDLDAARVKSALDQGAEWGTAPGGLPGSWQDEVTGGYGVDLALVTAAAENSAPLQLAAELCRLRGRISMVGAMPMELDRRTFYEKELELRMSTSYGPGRYDRSYEEVGLDYPLPYVRWTENRNLQAFLALVASRAVTPQQLDTEIVPFEEAVRAYDELAKGQRRSLAMLFRYAPNAPLSRTLPLAADARKVPRESLGVAFLGAGNYAKAVLLPALPGPKQVRRVQLVTATGPSARRSAERFGFAVCGTDPEAVFADRAVDLIFVATRHDSHARLAARALRAGKAVWLEKPAALSEDDLADLESAVRETGGFLAVGYNRRFSRHTRAVKEAFAGRVGPLALHYSLAAGSPPTGTWITDPREGGGRIVGEVCHFVDLCTYLVGTPPERVFARAIGRDPETDDSITAILGFPDGSTACLEYLARASTQLPKERFEVSADGRTARSENYRITRFLGGGPRDVKTMNQDKGQAAAVAEVVAAVREGRPSPFSLEELLAVSRTTFALLDSGRTGREVKLP
jgi:predicted dehydrogenase/threonine dehydrogenase-like Zn-dependent dehydrogenase